MGSRANTLHPCKPGDQPVRWVWGQPRMKASDGGWTEKGKLLSHAQVAVVKSLPASAGLVRDACSVPGSGRSPGGGHGKPLQSSCLENPMDKGAWQAIFHKVSKSRTHAHAWVPVSVPAGQEQSQRPPGRPSRTTLGHEPPACWESFQHYYVSHQPHPLPTPGNAHLFIRLLAWAVREYNRDQGLLTGVPRSPHFARETLRGFVTSFSSFN